MKNTIFNIVFLSILNCPIKLTAEETLFFPQTEAEWCKALQLHPECSDISNPQSSIEIKGTEEKGTIVHSSIRIQFYPNSAKVAKYDTALDKLGRLLSATPSNVNIIIEGHTDAIGSDAYNLRLSTKRAQVVRNYLIKHYDIAPQKLYAVGRGEDKPIASNDSEDGRSKNRRVEFKKQL